MSDLILITPAKEHEEQVMAFREELLRNGDDGAMNINRVWLIPKDAKRPLDGRRKTNRKQIGAYEIE